MMSVTPISVLRPAVAPAPGQLSNNTRGLYQEPNLNPTAQARIDGLWRQIRNAVVQHEDPLDHNVRVAPARAFQAIAFSLTDQLLCHEAVAASALCDISAMHPACELSIVVPVAHAQEANFIENFLKLFSKQTVRPERYEIVLYLNHGGTPSDRAVSGINSTEQALAKAIASYPNLNLRVLRIHYDKPMAIGAIRADAVFATLVRHIHRDQHRDHLLLNLDIDTIDISPNYISSYLSAAKRIPNSVAIKGNLCHERDALLDHPLLMLEDVSQSAIHAYLRSQSKYSFLSMGGPNLLVRASAYARTGFKEYLTLAEDVALTNELRAAGDTLSVGGRATLYTSARRSVAALNKGYPAHAQWSLAETSFGAENFDIRSNSYRRDFRFETRLFDPQFCLKAEEMLTQLCHIWGNQFRVSKDSLGPLPQLAHEVLVGCLGLPVSVEVSRTKPARGIVKVNDVSLLRRIVTGWYEQAA